MSIDLNNKTSISGMYSLDISVMRSTPSWTRKISELLGPHCLYPSSKAEGLLIVKTSLDLLFFF